MRSLASLRLKAFALKPPEEPNPKGAGGNAITSRVPKETHWKGNASPELAPLSPTFLEICIQLSAFSELRQLR